MIVSEHGVSMSEASAPVVLARYRGPLEAAVRGMVERRGPEELIRMLGYHLGWAPAPDGSPPGSGGKGLRGTLCLLAAEAVGGKSADCLPAGAAVELMHAFTLLHDDIADQDELRRGAPAVWRLWGVGQAVTAGDALFALANLAACRLQVPSDTLASVVLALNEAVLAICEGQHLDLWYEGRDSLGVEEYLAMIALKTAALFAAAADIGAAVGGGRGGQREALRRFGQEIGMAFQARDDALGLWGEEAKIGKKVGADLQRNKRSLPIVRALSSESPVRERLKRSLGGGSLSEEEAAAVSAEMEEAGVRGYCEQVARTHMERAVEALEGGGLCHGPAEELRLLARYLVERRE